VAGSGNTVGIVQGQSPGKATSAKKANPAAAPETPAEKSWWQRASPWVHGALDVLGFVPGLGAIPDIANAGIYALEGNAEEALWSLAAAVPGAGDAAKLGRLGVKAGKELVQRAEKELAQRAEKELAQKAKKKAAGKKKKPPDKKPPDKKDGGQVKGGPCDHLMKGNPNGKGRYRGGAFKGLKGTNEVPRHHIPPKSLFHEDDQGIVPSVQMDVNDHKKTHTWGSSHYSKAWHDHLHGLIKEHGNWDEAMRQGLLDLERTGGVKNAEGGKELMEFYKCLKENGLLPRLKDP